MNNGAGGAELARETYRGTLNELERSRVIITNQEAIYASAP